MAEIEAVGLVGVGTIGGYFTRRLLADGFDVHVCDVEADAVAEAVERGASEAETPADATRAADVVVLSLPAQRYVEAVMEGPDGVLEALEADQVVIDTGTTRPAADVRYERRCQERGGGYLDAPLTWGGPGEYTEARGPAFAMFVGGDPETYERARPVIESLSHTHRHYGPVGSGHVAKAGQRMKGFLDRIVGTEVLEFLPEQRRRPRDPRRPPGVGPRRGLPRGATARPRRSRGLRGA